jgi:hypothetical protein
MPTRLCVCEQWPREVLQLVRLRRAWHSDGDALGHCRDRLIRHHLCHTAIAMQLACPNWPGKQSILYGGYGGQAYYNTQGHTYDTRETGNSVEKGACSCSTMAPVTAVEAAQQMSPVIRTHCGSDHHN